jgi:hypothetical protein
VPDYPKRQLPILCVNFGYTPKAIVEILLHEQCNPYGEASEKSTPRVDEFQDFFLGRFEIRSGIDDQYPDS